MNESINSFLNKLFNLGVIRTFPRYSTRRAKKMFKDKPIKVIEIGVYEGENSVSIFSELNVEKFYAIDPYDDYEDYKNCVYSVGIHKKKKIAMNRLKDVEDRIVWIEEMSEDAVDNINEKVDFIYIDGNHDYEYVIKDMELYWGKLKDGGIMAGHDITNCKGVVEAVIEFAMKHNITPSMNRDDWYFLKEKQ